MKRSEALADLSRDHHQALSVALLLRRASTDEIAVAVDRFRDYFVRRGARHFELEEQILLPALPDERVWSEASERVRAEHRTLRALGDELIGGDLSDDTRVERGRELGAQLDAHVRFEERELFPRIEERLGEARLSEIGRRLSEASAA